MIGVFDSGFGGLTILGEFLKKMPQYSYVYLGDNARAPYGSRSYETVYRYTLQAVNKLFSMGCPLVILACNTASAKALRTIQQQDLPYMGDASRRVLGIIRPSAEVISQYTKTNKIGVLGTRGTVNSMSYPIEIKKLHPQITVYQQACPMWASLVENGEASSEGTAFFVKRDIDLLLAQDRDIDAIVLGCTHYPLLMNQIQQFVPQGIRIIAQNTIVANSLYDYLMRHPEMECRIKKGDSPIFLTTENSKNFDISARIFLGREVQSMSVEI